MSQKKSFKRHVDLLLIKEEKRHYVLITDFNAFMYGPSLNRGRSHFCCYCLHVFSTAKILKRHANDYLNINDKQMIKLPKKGEYVRFQNYERKIKSPFMIYADFESILVPKDI